MRTLFRFVLAALFLTALFESPVTHAGIEVVSGSVAGVLSNTNVRLEFSYDGLMIGEKTEAVYTAEKVKEKNAEESGSGDAWLRAWNEDRTARYHVKFVELMNKYLGKKSDVVVSETAENPDMVMLVKVTRIEPGFYSYVINRPAYLDLEITLVSGSKTLATIRLLRAPGTAVPDVRTRVGESYAKAAKDLAKWLAKNGG